MARKIYTYKGYNFRKCNSPEQMYGVNPHTFQREYVGEVFAYEIKKTTNKTWIKTNVYSIEAVKGHINHLLRKEAMKKRNAEFKKELDKTFGKLY